MNIFITLDYEIFFGSNQGTIEKTLIQPTDMLMQISRLHTVYFTFFIDVGFLIKLAENKVQFPQLAKTEETVLTQIKSLLDQGHDCQLHIHPHWEKAWYDGEKWVFDYNYYKLSDFSNQEVNEIFRKYATKLHQITQQTIHSFRAGGWCIQPFEQLKKAFTENKISIDSSVFLGGKHIEKPYFYDFTCHPNKDAWFFDANECLEDPNGKFMELPISSSTYSPVFFWKLFILGNLFPTSHKPIGDGKPMPSSLTRKKLLTKSHLMAASIDGYFASHLQAVLNQNEKNKFKQMVIIGHPKALTRYSLKKLSTFIAANKQGNYFKTFSDFKNEIFG